MVIISGVPIFRIFTVISVDHGKPLTFGSLVERKIVKDGDKSISWSPRVIRTRPPVRRSSLFSTGFKMGS